MSGVGDRALFECTNECVFSATNQDESVKGETHLDDEQLADQAPSRGNDASHRTKPASPRVILGEDIRCLIERLLLPNYPSTAEIKALISILRLDPQHIRCKCQILDHLFEKLARPGLEADLSMLFCYQVYHDLTSGLQSPTAVKNSNDPLIQMLAKNFMYDRASVRSMKRYTLRELTRFGCWIDASGTLRHGGSRRRLAYRSAAGFLVQFARFEVDNFAWKRIKRAIKEMTLELRHWDWRWSNTGARQRQADGLRWSKKRRAWFGSALIVVVVLFVALILAGCQARVALNSKGTGMVHSDN